MELSKDAYTALEDIVGPEYISQDPAMRDTYNQVWGNKLVFDTKFSNRPAAVVLPKSTEEVQAIVRVCNRHKIPFKPFSSGFEIVATTLVGEGSIIMDLRRMNRILDIDVKNMSAVVEPYVNIYRMQLELAKHGLYIGSIAAGPSAGVVATSCCHFGTASSQVFTGGLGRSLLGCEWVLPTGEILRMGSAEAGSDWYSADGPGFSLRGILRGHAGANGGHGVITKVSHKLYHWYGPPEWEFVGPVPAVKQPEKVPDGFRVFIFTFPSMENNFDALREIAQAEIAYSILQFLPPIMGEGNDEFWAFLQQMIENTPPDAPNFQDISLIVAIGANTKREMEYRERCLFKVAEKWGGVIIPELNDPKFLAYRTLMMLWGIGTVRDVFRACSDFFISPTTDASQDMIKLQAKAGAETIMRQVEDGAVMLVPSPAFYHTPYENYSTGTHIENVYFYDPYDEESVKGVRQIVAETFDPQGKFRQFGVPVCGGGLQIEPVSHIVQTWGPVYDNYDVWLRKIKEILDPNNLGDWSAYVPPVFP